MDIGGPRERKTLLVNEIENILLYGSEEEIAELRERFNLSKEMIEMCRGFVQARNDIHTRMGQDVAKRENERPVPTRDEYRMGAFVENIEPQVRDVVLSLRCKGYNTSESGFYNAGQCEQVVSVKDDSFENLTFPEELISEFKEKGVELKIKKYDDRTTIVFTFQKYYPLSDIKDMWARIDLYIPDRGHEAQSCAIRVAEEFRKHHPLHE